MVQANFSVTVKNAGELAGTESVELKFVVNDERREPGSTINLLGAGETTTLELSAELPPGHHQVMFIIPDSEMSVEVHIKAADVTFTELKHIIKGDGAITLEVEATNQGFLVANSVALSAHWVPLASVATDTNESAGSTEKVVVIEQLHPGQSRVVELPVKIPAGSYAFTLKGETESIEAFRNNNTAETDISIEYVMLRVDIQSVRHVGYERDGDGIVEVEFSVVNEGVASSGELMVGVMCVDRRCFQDLTLDSLQAGQSVETMLRVSVPQGVVEPLVFAGGLDEGYRWGEYNVGKITVNVAKRATESPNQNAETVVVGGYWSDGTAKVEVTPSLGGASAQQVTVRCSQTREAMKECQEQALVWPVEHPGPSAETLIMRLPMGAVYSLEFDYSGSKKIVEVEVPDRILGVERDVWECFSDTSNVGTDWRGLGIGCAGWSSETVTKWDQSAPVTVWVNPAGDPVSIRILKEVLDELSPIVNLEFHWVGSESEADFVAHVGLYRSEAKDFGVGCEASGVGCAGYSSVDGIIHSGSLVALGRDSTEQNTKELILHEALHVFPPMNHRHRDPTSVMSYYPVADQTVINHMDEALVRLYSHPLVKPGMGIDQVRRLIVFRDELLDRPDAAPLTAMEILKEAYHKLHTAGSARYTISWGQDSYWPDYEVANYQFERPRWTHVNDGANHYYMIDYWEYEMWRQISGHWRQVEWDNPVQAVPADVSGYHSLSPHYVLLLILEDYDRVEVEVLGRSEGNVTLKAKFDQGVAPGGGTYIYSSAEIVVVLYEKSYEIREYSFKGPGLGYFHAKDGQYGIEFEFPESIREISKNLSGCRSEPLGLLSGAITLKGLLPGSCGPDPKRNLRQHHFSLDQLTSANISIRMLSDTAAAFSDSSLVILRLLKGEDILASNRFFESPGNLSLGNVQLPTGDYIIELESFDPGMELEYELEIGSAPAVQMR